mmetsp:Transcript_819/g.1323  ORF Transcript_819/g.1323 Transcript_819/m.1323 type:complete len:286 (-) Transcript_819:141-998(-)
MGGQSITAGSVAVVIQILLSARPAHLYPKPSNEGPESKLPFQAVFVMSPEEDAGVFFERRKRMQQNLNFLDGQVPVRYMGFKSSQHDELLDELGIMNKTAAKRRRPAWGRIANIAGARQIWRNCAQGSADTCLVLEDDVDFGPREVKLLNRFLEHPTSILDCPQGSHNISEVEWECLSLGTSELSSQSLATVEGPSSTGEFNWVVRPSHEEPSPCLFRLSRKHLGSHAYLIKKGAADRLLQIPTNLPTDVFLGNCSQHDLLRAFVLQPSVVKQSRGNPSTTEVEA